MDVETTWRMIGLLSLAAAACLAAGMLSMLSAARRRRQLARPDWPRMLADPDYFRQQLIKIFKARGYKVLRWWAFNDPIERQPREVVMALQRGGQVYAALCGRWVIPITSEVVTRFEQALATTQASAGILLTTSHFSEAALDRARGLPVELHDGEHLQAWIDEIWA